MIKLVHISDLHLGKTLHGYKLLDDQEYILNQIIEKTIEYDADGLLIAGDIFDSAQRSEGAVKLWSDFLNKLSDHSLKAYIIAGNHDSGEKVAFAVQVFEKQDINIVGTYKGDIPHYCLKKDDIDVNIYLLPYVSKQRVHSYHQEEKIDTYDDAFRAVIGRADINEDQCNILVAHQFVRGGSTDSLIGGSENLKTRTCGTIEQIDSSCFDQFDYVALGHLHAPQYIGAGNKVRYSGTPLKYHTSESEHDKSMTLLTIDDDLSIDIKTIPLKPLHDICHVVGYFDELCKPEKVEAYKNHYVYMTLKDKPGSLTAPATTLHSYYPLFLTCDYEQQDSEILQKYDSTGNVKDKDFLEIFEDFYGVMRPDENVSDEELNVVKDIAKEVGLIDEA